MYCTSGSITNLKFILKFGNHKIKILCSIGVHILQVVILKSVLGMKNWFPLVQIVWFHFLCEPIIDLLELFFWKRFHVIRSYITNVIIILSLISYLYILGINRFYAAGRKKRRIDHSDFNCRKLFGILSSAYQINGVANAVDEQLTWAVDNERN